MPTDTEAPRPPAYARESAPEDRSRYRGGSDSDDDDGGSRRGAQRRPRRGRRAPLFTPTEVAQISYRDVDKLRKMISDRGRIEPRRKTGMTAADQRRMALLIKRARQLALLPYTADHMRRVAEYRALARSTARPPQPAPAPAPAAAVAESSALEAASPAEESVS